MCKNYSYFRVFIADNQGFEASDPDSGSISRGAALPLLVAELGPAQEVSVLQTLHFTVFGRTSRHFRTALVQPV